MQLESEIRDLLNSEVKEKVKFRIKIFERVGKSTNERWFSELSFCILTANSSAKIAISIQEELGSEGFLQLSQPELQVRLKELGHRFYRTRAEYIVEAREHSNSIKDSVMKLPSSFEAREWLVEEVKGIGYKEGSHFLRNVGFKNLMIVDRHVLRVVDECNVIGCQPKTLTRKRYLSIEEKIRKVANEMGLTLAEIDLYIWYMDTGEILK